MQEDIILEQPKKWSCKLIFLGLFFLIILFSVCIIFFVPKSFSEKTTVVIKKGQSAKEVGNTLKSKNLIYSENLFYISEKILGGHIVEGPYLFSKKESLFSVIKRLRKGEYGIVSAKITIPEGFTRKQIASALNKNLSYFDEQIFLEKTKKMEGYLFPDTYLIRPNQTEEDIIKLFTDTFASKNELIHALPDDKKNDVVKLASIVEREVRGKEDKEIVAEIFVKRMKIGMPLQADSTLVYERGGNSFTLSVSDLRTDSPYNTYTRKGLPPTPISNPGEDALDASYKALFLSTGTPYLYFLTDKDGSVHYAKTHDEHVSNKRKYLQ